jgi:hypothetical protein
VVYQPSGVAVVLQVEFLVECAHFYFSYPYGYYSAYLQGVLFYTIRKEFY